MKPQFRTGFETSQSGQFDAPPGLKNTPNVAGQTVQLRLGLGLCNQLLSGNPARQIVCIHAKHTLLRMRERLWTGK